MTTYIGLLRGVNVGGRKSIAMAGLRAMLADLGFEEPRTLLQSGNVVFRSDAGSAADLELLLETETAKRLGLSTTYFVRTAEEWREVIAGNPFPEEAAREPGRLLVVALKEAPDGGAVGALREAISGPEVVEAIGRHLYAVYPAGIGRSKLTLDLIERRLGTRGTGRNWNTVLKLGALSSA
jgi:uncharacterized protein (DUF1697 family)